MKAPEHLDHLRAAVDAAIAEPTPERLDLVSRRAAVLALLLPSDRSALLLALLQDEADTLPAGVRAAIVGRGIGGSGDTEG